MCSGKKKNRVELHHFQVAAWDPFELCVPKKKEKQAIINTNKRTEKVKGQKSDTDSVEVSKADRLGFRGSRSHKLFFDLPSQRLRGEPSLEVSHTNKVQKL